MLPWIHSKQWLWFRAALSSFCQYLLHGSPAARLTSDRMFNLALLRFNKYLLHNKNNVFVTMHQLSVWRAQWLNLYTYLGIWNILENHNMQNLHLMVINVSEQNAAIRLWINICIKYLYYKVYFWCLNENIFIFSMLLEVDSLNCLIQLWRWAIINYFYRSKTAEHHQFHMVNQANERAIPFENCVHFKYQICNDSTSA